MLPEVVGHLLHGMRPAKPPESLRLRDLPSIPMYERGWILLGKRPGAEIALGLVGKFWRPVNRATAAKMIAGGAPVEAASPAVAEPKIATSSTARIVSGAQRFDAAPSRSPEPLRSDTARRWRSRLSRPRRSDRESPSSQWRSARRARLRSERHHSPASEDSHAMWSKIEALCQPEDRAHVSVDSWVGYLPDVSRMSSRGSIVRFWKIG
jgi:hypothetical protein